MLEVDVKNMRQEDIAALIREADGEPLTLKSCMGQRYIGCGMKNVNLTLTGTPGNALGAYLDGGTIRVKGNAQDAVADTMNNGKMYIDGSAGDALGYAMRGGKIFIHGNAGYRAGVHMKAYEDIQPVIVIGGTAGSFLGEYLAGGTIIVLGLNREKEPITGFFCGNGMYSGRIYLRTDEKPVGLSEKLLMRKIDDEEKKSVIAPYIEEFSKEFREDYKKCMDGTFIVIEPNPKNSYKELYAAVS